MTFTLRSRDAGAGAQGYIVFFYNKRYNLTKYKEAFRVL